MAVPPNARIDRLVFTLDLEDHIGTYQRDARFVANTISVLDLLESLGIRGTFFVVAKIAETHPELIRRIARCGHEIACHSYDHLPITAETPESFATKLRRAKHLLEQTSGQKVTGYRAPIFSLTPATHWAVDLIGDAGFEYSSSVLPAANPLYGFSGAPRAPFCWPNGLLEFPVPVASFFGACLPFLGGVYVRYLPWSMIASAMRGLPDNIVKWTYFHPYDFDVDEPFSRMPGTGMATNLICWLNRRTTGPRLARLFADRSSVGFRDFIASETFTLPHWAPA
jgi:polysaccharide deacetylase family protein (PEP-CTERM system associated)